MLPHVFHPKSLVVQLTAMEATAEVMYRLPAVSRCQRRGRLLQRRPGSTRARVRGIQYIKLPYKATCKTSGRV